MGRTSAPRRRVAVLSTAIRRWSRRGREVLLGKQDLPKSATAPVRHYEQARHLHELTFSCDKRKPLLTNDVWRKILAAALTKAFLEEQFRLIAFVFLPEHMHLHVLPENPQSKVS